MATKRYQTTGQPINRGDDKTIKAAMLVLARAGVLSPLVPAEVRLFIGVEPFEPGEDQVLMISRRDLGEDEVRYEIPLTRKEATCSSFTPIR